MWGGDDRGVRRQVQAYRDEGAPGSILHLPLCTCRAILAAKPTSIGIRRTLYAGWTAKFFIEPSAEGVRCAEAVWGDGTGGCRTQLVSRNYRLGVTP